MRFNEFFLKTLKTNRLSAQIKRNEMAENKKSMKYIIFDGSNYNNWKYRMNLLLDDKNLLEYVEYSLEEITLHVDDREYRKHIKKEKKCRKILVEHIDDSQLEYVKDKLTAKEIYDALQQVFERKSIAGQLWIRRKLLTMKYNENGAMKDHILEFDKNVRELKAIGGKPEEMDLICQLLLTLPRSFNPIVTALETLNPETMTMDFVKCRLLDEYNKRSGSKVENGTSHSHDSIAMNASSSFKYRCFNCGQSGHKRSDCPKPYNCSNKDENSNDNHKRANMAVDEDQEQYTPL